MSRFRADVCLLLAALIWGAAFIAQKYANDTMTPLMFGGVRFMLGAFVLMPFARREAKKHRKSIARRDWFLAVLIGVALFVAISLQQVALLTTTATNAGFLTSIYMVLVPFAAWAVQGVKPRAVVLLSCVFCMTGAGLLAGQGVSDGWRPGDVMLLVSDVVWAFHIVLVSRFLSHTHRPFFLAMAQYGITGILSGLCGLLFEPVTLHGIYAAWPAILYASLISAGIAYTLQIVAQRYTPAAEASIIMSMEGVFAAIAGAAFLGERLTFLASIGCGLILGGILMVEIGPLLSSLKRRKGKRLKHQ